MALILKYYHDLTYVAIAKRMNCSEKAVESLLGRARRSSRNNIPDWVPSRVLANKQHSEVTHP